MAVLTATVRKFVDVNNNGLDKVIPRSVLERAQGFAIFTVVKAGFVVSARAGSGVVIARLEDGCEYELEVHGDGGAESRSVVGTFGHWSRRVWRRFPNGCRVSSHWLWSRQHS